MKDDAPTADRSSRRVFALAVGGVLGALLIAAPFLSGRSATLDPAPTPDERIDVGAVDLAHEESHEGPIVLEDRGIAVLWFDPRQEGTQARFAGALRWQPDEGLTAVSLRDPSTDAQVAFCRTSRLFEGAGGGAYNDFGEWVDGPAPRGLDRHPVILEDGRVIVDPSVTLPGPPRDGRLGWNGPRGPRCERP